MTNILLLIVCFLAGILLHRTGKLPSSAPAAFNGFIVYVSLPALTLLHIHRLELDLKLLFPAAMAWVVFGGGVLFFQVFGKITGLSRNTVGALIMTGALGNTSFVGLPMIEAYYGKDQIAIGLIADQFGSFPVLATLGILVATIYSSGEVSVQDMARKIFLFPPFIALIVAFLLRPLPYPDWLSAMLQKVGDTLTPLALVSVGYQLRLGHIRGEAKPLAMGLLYKLVLAPAVVALFFVAILGGSGKVMQVTLFEAAMAPMITGGIIAIEHDLNPPLATLMVGVGIPLSFLTLPVWWWLLQAL